MSLIDRLRSRKPASSRPEWSASGVKFVCTEPALEAQFDRAVGELFACIKVPFGDKLILQEGGIYLGCWLESTGTINAELLSRYLPDVAENTFLAFADGARADGLLPYKVTDKGAVFAQIQRVTPLARSVWTHYKLNGGRDFLSRMYQALAADDAWLAANRDTRGSGGVEAFCCYDTGHDLSARFWHVPDSPFGNDPARFDQANPRLPFIAPDLTAHQVCQRESLAVMAEELGEDGSLWRAKAEASRAALTKTCYDAEDDFFYDRDATGAFVRVQSDVLLRVLACGIGDDEFFERMLKRYLLNTRKFFARFPFTSIALDDPRFDPEFAKNSWSGPTNFLSLIRAAHAFEAHGHHAELTWVIQPILDALQRAERFSQTLSPFTGDTGFTESYAPAILCLLDFVERLSGIMPRPDGTLWFSTLTPRPVEHRDAVRQTAYARRVDGVVYELENTAETCRAWKDGAPLFAASPGLRVITTREGQITGAINVNGAPLVGEIASGQGRIHLSLQPNEEVLIRDGKVKTLRRPGVVPVQT
jgi:hypothetical protein